MKGQRSEAIGRAAELKVAFDKAFAAAPTFDSTTKEDLLAIRLGPAHCALRLTEIRGVFADKRIVRVPARNPALLGIASFRGAILPVYNLHALLGHPIGTATRWLAIAEGTDVALAFEEVSGHLRVSRNAIAPQLDGNTGRNHIREFVRVHEVVRGVIDLQSVIAAIKKNVSRGGS